MKKTIAILLCLCLLLCCGCGAIPSQTSAEGQSPSPEAGGAAEEAEAPASPEVPADEPPEEPVETPAEEPAEETPEQGEEAAESVPFTPDFTFATTDRRGAPWTEEIFSQYTLTMINFWEPWCGPCVREMPDLQRLYETYADRGLLILGVYSTQGMEDDVDEVLAETGVSYPILQYCADFDSFDSCYVPTTIFVDQQGHVLHRELSQEERDYFADVIERLGEEGAGALYIGSASYEDWASIVEGLL